MCMSICYICMGALGAPFSHSVRFLKLDLQMVVNNHVSGGT